MKGYLVDGTTKYPEFTLDFENLTELKNQ